MKTLATVKEMMSFVKDNESKYTILITSCSEQEIYKNFYSNFPDEMKELDITLIEFQSGCIILHVL